MAKLNQIVDNSYEDFTDELASNYIYAYSKHVFEPLKKQFDSGTVLDEALQSAISTFEVGIRNQAIFIANQFLYEKLKHISAVYLAYIFAGKAKIVSKLKGKGIVGGAVTKIFKFASNILGSTDERIQMTKIANDMSKEISSSQLHQKEMLYNQKRDMDNLALGMEKNQTDKKMQLYLHKCKTGTWQKKDKKLYEDILGKIPTGVSWTKIYEQLNQFSEYTLTAEKEIANFSSVLLDNLTALQVQKIR
ncbi:MAG: hypothetical protein GXO30_04845 [Epsilonproteobacteria bacterium]|nr:hypothetical protein [Campylobacterota bacterium]